MSSLIQQEWQSLAPQGVSVCFFDECRSTNSLATEQGALGFDQATWFVANRQTDGRGRRGRSWLSNDGNLFCSLLTRLELKMSELSTLPYLVSLAVRDTFIQLGCDTGAVQCKWPNDVLICEKKSSGILIETSAGDHGTIDFVVIGIGLNLAHYPSDAQFPATCVSKEIREEVATSKAFKILASRLKERLDKWNPSDVAQMIEEWVSVSWGLSQRREIRTSGETFMATLNGLDEKGGLELLLDDGTRRTLYAGDVFGSPGAH
ncbi:MAG: biotin--[acetyl-CoA-carboxylase] ligase [Kordiimonadaceae bacterium]|nr:biotin--[acetyl-CoA-carboxylase] ligase [Kordiimonadaceae bacterium]MBO6570346.1 biotin--[acetyl-CoA-carboxylase] ligase [Kordiimonadaceae bacterium]MBO6965556.1 biotin--[acetyl-CoA-carboxylase] ligase [Kordiimonadaceae bacterium]